MKSYKFNTKSGLLKVRFYPTGCFSVVDFQGCEHELGEWEKQPIYLDKEKTRVSKDKNSVTFSYKYFGKRQMHNEMKLADAAYHIANKYFYKIQYESNNN